ncbi:pentatricopeptide repeat-containing protein, mitochondrial isoform X2 [Cinnamomum micranthum f. kanehirae]|uniref:Pentatricopeptide repeat-containing protein, mitochondrial isoform X2 n=1 Tax=Cinnamomum micranthum f. kanehirae TaxID=337451 RepID=A0A3S4PPS0_9MAGN|nr:pentatricopeptide repeat-containing protein, mitochondrial isoform X2 [Cinnamomum micranthum f. kanehirae]
MPVKDLFSRSALISGFVQSGDGVKGLKLFVEMRTKRVEIRVTFILCTAVGAAFDLGVLELGRQLHFLVVVLGYESNIVVGNFLVDLYAKCSVISAAKQVFDNVPRKDIFFLDGYDCWGSSAWSS